MLFAAGQGHPARIDRLLSGWMLWRVYSRVLPELPDYDLAAPAHVRNWQCRILRDYWLIHRRGLMGRMKP